MTNPIAGSRGNGSSQTNDIALEVSDTVSGFRPSEADFKWASCALGSLNKQELDDAMWQMKQKGALEDFTEGLQDYPAAKQAFLKVLIDKGFTTEEGTPKLLRNDKSLEPELASLIHSENQARAAVYMGEAKKRLEGYGAAVARAPDADALRKIGKWVPPARLDEPGALGNPNFKTSALTPGDFGERVALEAVSDRISDFRGEVHAGSLGIELSRTLTAKGEGSPASYSESQTVVFSTHGIYTSKSREVSGRLGDEALNVALGADPDTGQKSIALNVGDDKSAGAFSVKKEGDKTTMKATYRGAGGYTVVSPEKGEARAGLVGKVPYSGFVDDTFKVGVVVQGVAAAYAHDVGSNQTGFFGPMPELDAGTPFSSLPKERQGWYQRQGFTEPVYTRSLRRASAADED